MCTISLFVNNPYMDLDQDCNAHCYNSTGKDFFIVFICMFTFWVLWRADEDKFVMFVLGSKIGGKSTNLLELQLLLDHLTGHLGEEEVWYMPQISFLSSLKLQFLKVGPYIVALIWQWWIDISAPLLSFAIYQTHGHHIYIAWGSLIRVLFLNCFSLWRLPSVECHLLLSQQ